MLKKKKAFLLFVVLFIYGFLFAAELEDQKKSIALGGYLDSYCTISVDSIRATAEDTSKGLPFNIMGDSVRYNSSNIVSDDLTGGRVVSKWTLATNSRIKTLTVKASKFEHESKTASIDYYISFVLSYTDNEGTPQTKYLTLDTSSDGDGKTFTIDCSGPVISEEKDVLVMFKEYADEEREAWPNGYYEANVSFILTGE